MTNSMADTSRVGITGLAPAAAGSKLNSVANTALKAAVRSWFFLTFIGQWLFVTYVAGFYGGAALRGNLEKWNTFLPNGYIAGDTTGNILLALHLFLAVTIIVQGPLQFIPQIRSRAPGFHRWNGRIYMVTAFVISIAAIYLKFSRELHEHMNIVWGFTLNGVLIMVCAGMAWRYALARDFRMHSRWALRLYTMVSAIWIYRVGFVAWLLINQGKPVGHTADFHGWFDAFWGFGYVLLPLIILEAYLYVKDRAGPRTRLAMAGALFLITGLMGISTLIATAFFWIPNLTPGGANITSEGALVM